MKKFADGLSRIMDTQDFKLKPRKVAKDYNEMIEECQIRMFRSLATALSLYGEVIERMKSEFQEGFSSGEICGYLDQQKLNIMHKLVDRCMPHYPHCRAAAYTLIKADEYGDPNDFYIMAGGLFDAIESAEFELNQMGLQQKYSGIEEFPSN